MHRRLTAVEFREVHTHDAVRIVAGLVLLVAAGLKGYQLSTEPLLPMSGVDSRWFLNCVVEFELLFGVWLLSGLARRWSTLAAVACFGFFACISIYKALSGAESCGCFGTLTINPWYTATLDVTIVSLLLHSRPWAPSRSHSLGPIAWRLAIVFGLWILVGGTALVGMWQGPVRSVTDLGEVSPDDRIVILTPEAWTGKRLPLLDYLDSQDVGATLEEGSWLVLLYHDGCPRCQQALDQLSTIAQRARGARSAVIGSAEPNCVRVVDPTGSIADMNEHRLRAQYGWTGIMLLLLE